MLKRVVLAFPTAELAGAGLVSPRLFLHNERVEVVDTFNFDEGTTTLLVRLLRRPGAPRLGRGEAGRRARMERYGLRALEVVEEAGEGREYTLLVRQRNSESLQGILRAIDPRVFPVAPCVLDGERTVLGLGGPEGPLRRALALLRRLGLPYRTLSIGPYRVWGRRVLTERQAMAVGLALDLGFFAVPRRTDLRTLGRIMGISPVALGKLLRRAEERILREALGEVGGR